MIEVVGCPRSGTCFISTLFVEHGYDVGHENWGKDGIACWRLAGNSDFWRERSSTGHVVHQVRHPLKVIGSLFTIAEVSWEIMFLAVPEMRTGQTLERAMRCWYLWNQLAESRASYTYRVENFRQEYPEICRRAGFDPVLKPAFKTSETTNSREHREVTWADLEQTDAALTAGIKSLATRYGYAL